MARTTDQEQLLCSFCGKSQRQVKKLIAGPGVYICDECIELCNEIIDEELTEKTSLDLDHLPKPPIEKDRPLVDHHHPIAVSADGKYSIEFAECLASCGSGPVCMVNDDFYEAVTPEKTADLLAKYRAKA